MRGLFMFWGDDMTTEPKNEDEGLMQRRFTGFTDHALSLLCALIAIGHVYVAFSPIIS
jgi:hypothetical protein